MLDDALVADLGLALSILPSKRKVRQLLGIAEATWHRWDRRGRDEAGTGTIYARFHETLEVACTVFERDRLETILEAARDYEETETIVADVVDAEGRPTGSKRVTRKRKQLKGDWKAAAWILERRFHERYAARQEVKHEGELTLVAALTRIAHDEDETKRLEGGDV
jgi:hypothetical protein